MNVFNLVFIFCINKVENDDACVSNPRKQSSAGADNAPGLGGPRGTWEAAGDEIYITSYDGAIFKP